MLSENRQYDFKATLMIHKSKLLPEGGRPENDITNWLFCKIGDRQYSFVYKIEKPAQAEYGKGFTVLVAFAMKEAVSDKVELQQEYEVLRGEEFIGKISLNTSST